MLKCPNCFSDRIQSRGSTAAGSSRFQCRECHKWTTEPIDSEDVSSVVKKDAVSEKLLSRKNKTFVITSAQNATPIHSRFLESLNVYCQENDAELLTIPYRYKNPTSLWNSNNEGEDWWDHRLTPYFIDERSYLHSNCILLSDVKLQPTKQNPLTGLHGFSRNESLVVGHPKIAMETVATHPGDMAKILISTGSITLPNYTDSALGKRGNHHHSHGALVVEADGEIFHMRHIQPSEDGSFIDLDREYTEYGSFAAPPAKALVVGDLHHWFLDEDVDKAIFGKNGLIDTTEPEKVFLHDVIDGFSICPYHQGDPFIKQGKHWYNKGSIHKELSDFAEWFKERQDNREYVIVASNHHDWLQKWIKEADWRNDPENAEFYLETALYLTRNTHFGPGGVNTPDAFKYWIERLIENITVLEPDDSYMVGDTECGYHGHLGPNGSRGSLASMEKIGPKVVHGHVHSPGVRNGATAVGVSTRLNLNYTSGPSSWLQSHAVIDSKGKTKLINTIAGRFRRR